VRKHNIFLIIIGLVAFASVISGAYETSQGNFSGIAWPFAWIGIFIWGDAIILGSFLFLGSVFLWQKHNGALTGMFFSGYAALRSFIEIIYNLNAQFTTTTRPWESFIPTLASSLHLSTTEFFVLPQILWTAGCLVAILIFISHLKSYWKS
jgi:hypothetical protein